MILFVSGIDTGIGKSVATGLMAAWFQRHGRRVITQKLVQTGGTTVSEDIAMHRQLMNSPRQPEDECGLTCPALFPFPASPHLAARLAGSSLNIEQIVNATHALAETFDIVLVEGAGGLGVPLTDRVTTIDLVERLGWPVALVTAPRLGSINHTWLSIEALRQRRIPLAVMLYNLQFTAAAEIVADTRDYLRATIARSGYDAPLIDIPAAIDAKNAADWPAAGLEQLLS